ncbi:MAG TPA: ABC transporter permease, partial [Alphaproteobacteria bacterium]|nr:ABC transporter permease [Alphaproteobacteria bacterium]
MPAADQTRPRAAPGLLALGARHALIVALVAVFAVFSLLSPSFLTAGNLTSVLVNNFTLLAIVSVAMTFAVAAGGIDL